MAPTLRTSSGLLAPLFGALALIACGPSGRDPGTGGTADGKTGDGLGNQDNCSDDAKQIYVVDENNQLSQFLPATKTFHDLGTLNCPAMSGATPFSMAVDRTATAWVLYNSGELFSVNTTTLACTKSSWTAQSGLEQFGMGFSTDTAGGSTDTLFVAGGIIDIIPPTTSKLATLNLTSMQAGVLGTVQGNPELTGTGNAELWGFFPDATGPRVEKLNKATGGALKTYQAPSLAGDPMAWAFAFWGGDFWIFLMKGTDTATTVYQMDSNTGAIKGTTQTGSRTIVGAGVSTCAPTVIL